MGYWTIRNGDLVGLINQANGQLCSLMLGGVEFLHGGGKRPEDYGPDELHPAAWKHSEFPMFPVGKAHNNLYRDPVVETEHNIGQHGLPRHLAWKCTQNTPGAISLVTTYHAGSIVPNTKPFPHEEPHRLDWPHSFSIEKEFVLHKDKLLACFRITNQGVRDQFYTFGWHPAFKIPSGGFSFTADDAVQYAALPSSVDQFIATTHAVLRSKKYALDITSNFGALQLWRPNDAPLVCVEPLTAPMNPEGYKDLAPPYGMILEQGKPAFYQMTVRILSPTA